MCTVHGSEHALYILSVLLTTQVTNIQLTESSKIRPAGTIIICLLSNTMFGND